MNRAQRMRLLMLQSESGMVWPQAENLAGLYLCDGGSGTTLNDSSGNDNHGTFGASTAAPSWVTEGVSFDGGDHIELPGNSELDLSGNNATLAVVFNVSSTQCIMLGAYTGSPSFHGYGLSLNGGGTTPGGISIYTDGGGWDKPGNGDLTGSWHSIIAVLSGGTWSWTLDGNSYGSPVSGASISGQTDAKRISAYYPIVGTMAKLGVWSAALSASDVAAVYSNHQTIMAARGVSLPDPT
jgi:hypothetical protein